MNLSWVNPPAPTKSIFFSVLFVERSKVKLRLTTNRELKNFLAVKPDVFSYGESETTSSHCLRINGYVCYLDKSNLSKSYPFSDCVAVFGKPRRGHRTYFTTHV